MFAQVRAACTIFLMLSVITGVIYPAVVTAIAQVVFPDQANGSLIEQDGKVVGSSLIGQSFSDAKYFWGRPSATPSVAYNGASSGGSNLGPTNPALTEAVRGRVDALHAADPGAKAPVPVDLVTASGSGLDPHISPAAAEYQIERIARARHLEPSVVREMVAQHTDHRTFGVLGEPRVNVLHLNLKLDEMGK